jgi:FkbM family methyltransferase
VSFDRAINERHNCHVYAFDPTPKSINWVKNNNYFFDKFHFYEFGIDIISGFVDFYLPINPEHVSGGKIKANHLKTKISVSMKSMQDILLMLGHSHIDVFKMDIEGTEYEVIDDILNANISINQILIEFHDRFYKDGKSKTKQAIKKLRESGYEIFAVSSSFQEISFIKRTII